MHASRLLGTVGSRVAVSVADATRAFVGTSVEVGLVNYRCAPDVAFRSYGQFNHGDRNCLLMGRHISLRNPLALCVYKLLEEAGRPVGMRRSLHR